MHLFLINFLNAPHQNLKHRQKESRHSHDNYIKTNIFFIMPDLWVLDLPQSSKNVFALN